MTSDLVFGFLAGLTAVNTIFLVVWIRTLTREVNEMRLEQEKRDGDFRILLREVHDRQVNRTDLRHMADLLDRRCRRVESRLPETDGPDLRPTPTSVPLSSWERISADDKDGV